MKLLVSLILGIVLTCSSAVVFAEHPEKRERADSRAKADKLDRESNKAAEASEKAAREGRGFEARERAQQAVDKRDAAQQERKKDP